MRCITTAVGVAAAIIAASFIGVSGASAAEASSQTGSVTAAAIVKKVSSDVSSADLAGGTVTIPGNADRTVAVTVTTADKETAAGRRAYLQRWDDTAGVWNTKSAGTLDTSGQWPVTIGPSNTAVKWRLLTPATSEYAEDTSPPTTINRVRSTVKVKAIVSVNTTSALAPVELKFLVYAPAGTKVFLQKRIDSRWVQAKTAYTAADEVATFQIPAAGKNSPAASAPQFRVVVPSFATGYRDTYSATRTVNIENPMRYTGERRAYFGLVAAHCPSALLVIDHSLTSKGRWGSANMRAGVVRMAPGIPAVHQQFVANHECAHLRQWEMHGHDWSGYQAAAAGLYGGGLGHGYERMADCIADGWNRATYWGYSTGCAGQLGVAGRVMASGAKYFHI